ncbi:Histone deacetylase 14 [Picochlorum sp. SENEW3]|nr:Histone deacetylase 14 [Picochlorum sp. SENEW3]
MGPIKIGFYTAPKHTLPHPETHIENPERLEAMYRHVKEHALVDGVVEEMCSYYSTREASREEIGWVHGYYDQLVDRVQQACMKEDSYLCVADDGDPDGCTYAVESSVTDAKRAAGVVLDLVDCVCGSEEPTTKAMACVRPPGHHATGSTSLGFCIFNSVAIAVRYAMKKYDGIERVLLVDFDLHNGNGTAEIFWESSDVCVVDIHEKTQVYEPPEFVPNDANAVGGGKGHGYTVNVPLEHASGHHSVVRVMEEIVKPVAERIKPNLVMVSAGFDGHRDDPFGMLCMVEETYEYLGGFLSSIADTYCDGKILFVLEGGYNPDALGKSVVATLQGVVSQTPAAHSGPPPSAGDLQSDSIIDTVKRIHSIGNS